MHVIQQDTDQEFDPSHRHHQLESSPYHSGSNEVLFDAHYSESSRSTRSTSLTDDSDYNKLGGADIVGGCMDIVMPSIEQSYRESFAIHDQSFEATSGSSDDYCRAAHSSEFEHSIEDPIDLDIFRDNTITVVDVNPKHIAVNKLNPREQEEAGKYHNNVSLVQVIDDPIFFRRANA